MKDSTRDKICKSPQYVQKKSQYSIYQQKKKNYFLHIHTYLKNISKANSFSHLVTEVRGG